MAPLHHPSRTPGYAPASQGALDRLTALAGETLGVGSVCVSLVDAERRLVTSSYGLPVPLALLLSHAFRTHVITSRRPLVVTDGQRDPVVADNPAVRDGTVRACVGLPLDTADGRPVGTLLAMDQRAREWTVADLDLLRTSAALIVSEIELGAAVRRVSRRAHGAVAAPEAEPSFSERRSARAVGRNLPRTGV